MSFLTFGKGRSNVCEHEAHRGTIRVRCDYRRDCRRFCGNRPLLYTSCGADFSPFRECHRRGNEKSIQPEGARPFREREDETCSTTVDQDHQIERALDS